MSEVSRLHSTQLDVIHRQDVPRAIQLVNAYTANRVCKIKELFCFLYTEIIRDTVILFHTVSSVNLYNV